MKKLYYVGLGLIICSMMQGMEHSCYFNITDMQHFFRQSKNVLNPKSASISAQARSLAQYAIKEDTENKIPTELKEKVVTLKKSLKSFDKNYEEVNDPIGKPLVVDRDLVEAFLFLTRESENFDENVKRLIGYAAIEQSREALEYFFDYHKLDLNMILDEEYDSNTALHTAALAGKPDAMKWLLQKGAAVNSTNKSLEEETPLHTVCAFLVPLHDNNCVEAAKCLLEHKADINALNARDETPLDRVNRAMQRANIRDNTERVAKLQNLQKLIIAHGGLEGKEIKKLSPQADDPWNDRIYRLPPYQKKTMEDDGLWEF